MAFLQVGFFSKVLNVESSINVLLPEANLGIGVETTDLSGSTKVLYLLHGYSDDHTIWMRRTSIERYVSNRNLAVIMPAVNHSFYCNEHFGERYWDYVTDELPQIVHSFFRVSSKPQDTYVAGLSMGGYGAMRMALTYPERFAAAASFSGAVDLVEEINYLENKKKENWERVMGDSNTIKNSPLDNMFLLKKNSSAPHKPKLYVSCGTKDFLYYQHNHFVSELSANHWDVTHYEKPDEIHSWGFWDEEIKKFIDFIYQ